MSGLYLHIPFCEKKCSYCDFYSIENTTHLETFADTLLAELALRKCVLASPLTSVFFGGGTPSLLSPETIARTTEYIRSNYSVDPLAEWTMECNPGTVTQNTLSAYKLAGINRVSFGVQSLQENELQFLDRIHSADEARAAIVMARAAGFDNVNMDIMFAVPGQTLDTLRSTIEQILALAPDHISAYSLIYEQGTPLYNKLKKGLVVPTPEETDVAMYAYVISTLRAAGYRQYEVSNFALPNKECRHNLTYWHAGNYIAVGPSAHGYINGTRYWNYRSLSAWISKVLSGTLPEANSETLTTEEQASEFLFLALRADGIPVETFHARFGSNLRTTLQPHLTHWIDAGFVVEESGVLRLSAEGYRVCDEISAKIASIVL